MAKETLLSVSEKDYGSKYKDHLFDQYKLYIEGIERISDRRQNADNYFIAINTALISLIGLSIQYNFLSQLVWVKAILAFIGLVICLIFWFLIRSYKQLNTGKFKVLHEIEQYLPAALYKYEWEVLDHGRKRSTYYPFSHIELLIPYAFGIVYLVLFFALVNGVTVITK